MPDPTEASFWTSCPRANTTPALRGDGPLDTNPGESPTGVEVEANAASGNKASTWKSAETPQVYQNEDITVGHIQLSMTFVSLDSTNALPTDHGHQNQRTLIINAAADGSSASLVIDPSDSELNPDLDTESEMSDSLRIFKGNDKVGESTVDGPDQLAPAQTHDTGISVPSSEGYWKDRKLPKLEDLPDQPESAAGRGRNLLIQELIVLSPSILVDIDIDRVDGIDLVNDIAPNHINTINTPGFLIDFGSPSGRISPHMNELHFDLRAGLGLGDLNIFVGDDGEEPLLMDQ